jgi:pyruvate formate-lyase activating enzyme-like uncharacterized protein
LSNCSAQSKRAEQVENRVVEMEDKVEELYQTLKDHGRMLREDKWNMEDIRDTMKRPSI